MLRRCLLGETIVHRDKTFSAFEPHTRMIGTSKAGVPFCILEDQHQFILGFTIIWEGVDAEAITALVCQVMESFPTLDTLSTGKEFWLPKVYAYLSSNLALAAIPPKGCLNKEEKERQGSAAFAHAGNRHAGIESTINGLQHGGLKRALSCGSEGFARTISAAVFSANLIRSRRTRRNNSPCALRLKPPHVHAI